MKIKLMVVGKTLTQYIETGISEYSSRVVRYNPFEIDVIPDLKKAASLSPQQRKQQEGEQILSRVSRADTVVLLDERGREFTSREFARFIDKSTVNAGVGALVFVVGGPYGFSDEVYQRADAKMSLSKMTFPHELVRLFFVEQLYRAMTIRRGEPYHHD